MLQENTTLLKKMWKLIQWQLAELCTHQMCTGVGGVRGVQPPPPPWVLFLFLFSRLFVRELERSCTRIPLPQFFVWEIELFFFEGEKKKVSASNCKTPPLKNSCVHHWYPVPLYHNVYMFTCSLFLLLDFKIHASKYYTCRKIWKY